MRAFLLFIILCLFITENSWSQVSMGGHPYPVAHLKSSETQVVEMPAFDNGSAFHSVQEEIPNELKLKPFRFAHAFEVNFTTQNSGTWYKTDAGINVWQLKICSKGAKSINLIFDQFYLPTGARLFIFNEKENAVLGAFTSANNKVSGKFAVSPVAGDEITVQYEIPSKYLNEKNFAITRVNHDYVGIMDANDRRPLGKAAGACNIDVNCDLGNDWQEVKNSVCRMIVNGVEVCSGALVNNTAEDQKPYIISAAHCYDKWEYAETSVYVFNYESPFCAPLDGDPANSVSGAVMKAQFDSLDFALAELSLVPPPGFRPYFAGWERSAALPDSGVSIHHPWGDIKKIAIDEDAPVIASFNGKYITNGFLKVLRWEDGVTEVGSSGGPLFNTDKNLIGTLTGGLAVCGNPIEDYFERFALSWDYRSDSTKQLKHWLDPLNTGTQTLAGKQFYEGEEHCAAYTNLNDNDEYATISLIKSETFEGYWGGTNNDGITEFVEQFSIDGNEQLSGVSLGIAKIDDAVSGAKSAITIKVYNGAEMPGSVIYSKKIEIGDLVDDAMNFIGFDEIVQPSDTFYVGFELSDMQPLDTFVVYQSLRGVNTDNYFYFKQNDNWHSFEAVKSGYNSMVNVFELVACNIDDIESDTPVVDNPLDIFVFPNPAESIITVKAGKNILIENIGVVNLIGQSIPFKITQINERQIKIDLAGNVPGIYFLRFNNGDGLVSKKISFVPW